MTDPENRTQLLAKLQEHAKKVDDYKRYCTDEAKTRNYLVEPMLDLLGYNCRNPRDVVFEFAADVAGRKGEKVDYALMREDEPVVLVEAKTLGNKLRGNEREQLQRYFPFTPARLAVLTDGVRWRWYKGMSEPGRSHEMESSPFLTYNAQEPNESAAEWLIHLTKDGFDPVELLRIARRIGLTANVRAWIDDTLVDPSLDGARRFNATAGLGASDDELPLVVEAIRLAWTQAAGGRVVVEQRGTEVSEDSNLADLPASSTAQVAADQTETLQMSEDSSEGGPSLEFEPHWDDRLDIGDGKVLDARKRPRAWRMGDGDWVEEKNGTATILAVLGELLRCDWTSWHEPDLALTLDLHYSETKPGNHNYRLIPGFSNTYFYVNINNDRKSEALEQIARRLTFDPPPDSPLASTPRIEWWLPNKPKPR